MNKITEIFKNVTTKILDYIDNNITNWIDGYMTSSEEEVNAEIDKIIEEKVNNE